MITIGIRWLLDSLAMLSSRTLLRIVFIQSVRGNHYATCGSNTRVAKSILAGEND